MPVIHVERVPDIPGGASVCVDDQPGNVVIWMREDLTAEEAAQALSQALTHVAARQYWTRALAPTNHPLSLAG